MSFRATRLIALLTRAAARAPTTALRPLLSTRVTPSTTLQNLKPPSLAIPQTNAQVRTYAIGATSGKSQADLLVDELQELYEVAKDEFEIATDSTDNATIYAASDRDSCRDALNQLLATYSLYTSSEMRSSAESHQPQQAQPDDGGVDAVGTGYDPGDIEPGVRDEVRRRVGQRVRELENAVQVLEERAQAD